tara:strand:+ start:601 stop:1533 length:933 start_codon:yes stop_codon:yes gene_type:complete
MTNIQTSDLNGAFVILDVEVKSISAYKLSQRITGDTNAANNTDRLKVNVEIFDRAAPSYVRLTAAAKQIRNRLNSLTSPYAAGSRVVPTSRFSDLQQTLVRDFDTLEDAKKVFLSQYEELVRGPENQARLGNAYEASLAPGVDEVAEKISCSLRCLPLGDYIYCHAGQVLSDVILASNQTIERIARDQVSDQFSTVSDCLSRVSGLLAARIDAVNSGASLNTGKVPQQRIEDLRTAVEKINVGNVFSNPTVSLIADDLTSLINTLTEGKGNVVTSNVVSLEKAAGDANTLLKATTTGEAEALENLEHAFG